MDKDKQLFIWHLWRNPEVVGYDESAGYVVVAHSEEEARQLAYGHIADEYNDSRIEDEESVRKEVPENIHPHRRYRGENREEWLTTANCEMIGVAKNGMIPGIIIEDHISG